MLYSTCGGEALGRVLSILMTIIRADCHDPIDVRDFLTHAVYLLDDVLGSATNPPAEAKVDHAPRSRLRDAACPA